MCKVDVEGRERPPGEGPPAPDPTNHPTEKEGRACAAGSQSTPSSGLRQKIWRSGVPRHQLRLLFLSNVLDMLALALVLPSYPKICESLHIDAKTRGVLISLYSALQFFSSPILGRASDTYGRANLLRLSAFTSTGCYLLMLLAHHRAIFIMARVLPGLLKCGVAVSQAFVTDVSAPSERAQNLGLLGASFGVAFVVGPAIGGVLMGRDLWLPVKVSLCVTMINLSLLFCLGEPQRRLPSSNGTEPVKEKKAPIKRPSMWELVRRSPQGFKVVGLLARKAALSLCGGLLETNFAQFLEVQLNVHGPLLGLVLSYLGVLSVLNNAVLVRVLTRRVEEGLLLVLASIGLAIALFLFGFVKSVAALLVVMALVSVTSATLGTVTGAQLSSEIPHDLTGAVLGLSWAVETFSKIVAAPLGGFVLEAYGPGWIGWVGAAVLVPCLAEALFHNRRARRRGQAAAQQQAADDKKDKTE